jgi:hypothetical protein
MLRVGDIALTLVHLIIIGFNLFGWILPATRKAHFICVILTAFCWFVLGIWFGWGYCPVTDWQWHIKEKMGETNLPGSFITYYANKITGRQQFSDAFINIITLVLFLLAAAISVYVNFFKKKSKA